MVRLAKQTYRGGVTPPKMEDMSKEFKVHIGQGGYIDRLNDATFEAMRPVVREYASRMAMKQALEDNEDAPPLKRGKFEPKVEPKEETKSEESSSQEQSSSQEEEAVLIANPTGAGGGTAGTGQYDELLRYNPLNGCDGFVHPYTYRHYKLAGFNTTGQSARIAQTTILTNVGGILQTSNKAEYGVIEPTMSGVVVARNRWKVIPNGNLNLWLSGVECNEAVGRGAVAYRIKWLKIESKGIRWAQLRGLTATEQTVASAPWLAVFRDLGGWFRAGVDIDSNGGNGTLNYSENDYPFDWSKTNINDASQDTPLEMPLLKWLTNDQEAEKDVSYANNMPDPFDCGPVAYQEVTKPISWMREGDGEWHSLYGEGKNTLINAFNFPLEGHLNARVMDGTYGTVGTIAGQPETEFGNRNNAGTFNTNGSVRKPVDLLALTMPVTTGPAGFVINHSWEAQLHYSCEIEFYYSRHRHRFNQLTALPYSTGTVYAGSSGFDTRADNYLLRRHMAGALYPSTGVHSNQTYGLKDYTVSNGDLKSNF